MRPSSVEPPPEAPLRGKGGPYEEAAGGTSETGFAATLRAGRSRFLFGIGAEARSGSWRPGRGRRLAHWLSDETEAIIFACIQHAGPIPRSSFLVALGGLGRRELAPHSDIDLLLAFAAQPDEGARTWASALMRLLWDCGLKASLGVRTLRDCAKDADEDFDFLTSLAAGRLLHGDADKWQDTIDSIISRRGFAALRRLRRDESDLADSLFGRLRAADRKDRRDSRDSRDSRNSRDSEEIYAREPDLKAGQGTLRSLHRMEWGGLFSGRPGGREEWKRGLSARELARIDSAYDLQLWLRLRLHDRRGRETDLLRHEDLEAIGREAGMGAALLGSLLSVARRVLALAEFDFRERLARPRDNGSNRKETGPKRASDSSLLSAFLPLSRGEGGMTAALLRAWRPSPGPQGPGESPPLSARTRYELLRRLLESPASGEALAALDAAGILPRLLPAWLPARDLWSSASFHDRPVGPHSLRAIRFADLLLGPDRKAARVLSAPLADIASRYRETGWIVKLALLLHDLGKAFQGDHAKNGAALAESFLADLPTEPLIKEMLVFLVEEHLLLSKAARGFDAKPGPFLDEVVSVFASRAFPEDSFGLLAVLTACDMAATKEGAFSGYRRSSFEALAAALDSRLASRDGRSTREAIIADKLAEASSRGAGAEIVAFARRLGDRYILSNGVDSLERDYRLWRRNGHDHVDLEVTAANDHLKVKILAPDEPGLFASLAGILLANGADIVSADIHGLEGVAVDEFRVTEVFGNDLLADSMAMELSLWTEELGRSLRHYIERPKELALCVFGLEQGAGKTPEVFKAPAKVAWAREGEGKGEGEGEGLRIDLSCTDRPALLYDLAHHLSLAGFGIRAATIETRGFRVHDCFHLVAKTRREDAELDRMALDLAAACEGQGFWPERR
ncbi:MAG TPA: hypothetical protein VMV44_03905 [Rectinemataceae bacterium]|nr:hypothetical protein [Rectinemataceae bacterium]